MLRYGEKSFYEERGVIADPALFRIFSFAFINGSPETAFEGPYNIVITESMAHKYFGDEDPVGKTVLVEEIPTTVTGVIEDIPRNSHIQFDFVSSFQFIRDLSGWGTGWGSFNFVMYILHQKNADIQETGQKITRIAVENECPQVIGLGWTFRLQPLSRVHLDARSYQRSWEAMGDAKYVYMFTIIALLLRNMTLKQINGLQRHQRQQRGMV